MYINLNLPENQVGDFRIETFYQDGRRYQRLLKKDLVMMLNTPSIVSGFTDFLQRAEGAILINGLGIGMCCQYLLEKPEVTELTVIEYEADMVNLVAPNFNKDPRCKILTGDAFAYTPPAGKVYDYVWHDIWTVYAAQNVAEMDRLFEKYRDIAHWQGAWGRARCLQLLAERPGE